MQTLDELRRRLLAMSIAELTKLSAETTVPLATIIKLRHGTTKDPRLGTVEPLFQYFREQPAEA